MKAIIRGLGFALLSAVALVAFGAPAGAKNVVERYPDGVGTK